MISAVETSGPVNCIGGLKITAQVAIDDVNIGQDDIIVIPGGSPDTVREFPVIHAKRDETLTRIGLKPVLNRLHGQMYLLADISSAGGGARLRARTDRRDV